MEMKKKKIPNTSETEAPRPLANISSKAKTIYEHVYFSIYYI